jgi:chaperonin GroEL
MKFIAAGFDPTDLKRGIDVAVDSVVARLKENARKITSDQEIAQVTTISANGDPAIGRDELACATNTMMLFWRHPLPIRCP